MEVQASDRYKRRSKLYLEDMLRTNNYEGLGNIAFGLNKMSIWHDTSLTEKEVAQTLLDDINKEERK